MKYTQFLFLFSLSVANGYGVIPTSTTVICGGGPAGLLGAIMMAQKFPDQKVKVFDRLEPPPSPFDSTVWSDISRFYLIGLSGRGQVSLDKFGVWNEVEDACTAVVGRKDWAPGSNEAVERIYLDRNFTTQVLPRDKLVGVLYQHILDNYSSQVELNYGYDVQPLNFGEDGSGAVTLAVTKCSEKENQDLECDMNSVNHITADFLIAADGTARTIANEIEENDKKRRKLMNPLKRLLAGKPFTVTRYEDDNKRIYKTIPMKLPADWRPDINYSARSKGGRLILDALPANEKGEFCGVMLLRKDDEMAQSDADPQKFREFINEYLPMFSNIVDDGTVSKVAQKSPSFIPAFRYVGPRLHCGECTVVLGDCAHTVKPYFGLGANCALEDIVILSDAIDETESVKDAIQDFSKRRAKDSKTIVRISRDLDRPGTLGVFTFVIPIILDAIFSKIAPKVFAPNMISMVQREDMTFENIGKRKRMDRFLQLTIISAGISGATASIRAILRTWGRLLGRRELLIARSIGMSILGCVFLQKTLPFLVPGMAPADLLAITKTSVTEKDAISAKR
uniref:FAD-binding domain-containing protein n=1 Tax=Corethron hystrix TaxID=216773 RepID=A0A7S1BDM1_9STRA|mmetsp:Transcript_23585/g.53827  ORF Transcript_23585/g.53827 Transcript_23585/m.53827 type:complete len:565 (+) Transcript_23585:145-1839(+)